MADDLEALLAEKSRRQREGRKVPTFGEDISNLLSGLKNAPGAIGSHISSAAQHPGQVLAGIGTGLASIADLPALAYNTGRAIPKYVGEKISGEKGQEYTKLPYLAHGASTSIANLVAGEPDTKERQEARTFGEIVSPKAAKNVNAIGSKVGGFAEGLVPNAKRSAVNNLKQNLGVEAEQAIANKQAAQKLGINLKPSEASGNPLVAAEEGSRGITKEGALKLHEHGKGELIAQKTAINGLLDDIHASPEIVYDKVRDVSKTIINNKKIALQEKAAPYYAKAETQLVNKTFDDPTINNAIESVLKDPVYSQELKGVAPNSIKVLDVAKKRLDDDIGVAIRSGENHKASLLTKSKNNLVKEMDEVSSDYKKARSIYSEDLPSIKALEDSAIGKISNMNDEQLKNVSNTVFSSGAKDAKRIDLYRNEISKEAPEVWNALIRNHLEDKISKGQVNGSSFYKNVLQNENEYKNLQLALKGNPVALKKLHIVKTAFANLIGNKTAKTAAGLAKSSLEAPRSSLQYAVGGAKKLLFGNYDKAAVDLITGGKWDQELLALGKKSKHAQTMGLADILKRSVASTGVATENKSVEPQAQTGAADLEGLLAEKARRDAAKGNEQPQLSQNDSGKADASDFMDSLGHGGEANYNRSVDLFNNVGTQ